MGVSIRTFVAIPIASVDSILKKITQLQRCDGVRVVNTNSLHITLKFIGDTPRAVVDPVVEAVAKQTRDVRQFPLNLRGLSAFPNPSKPSVVWVGCEPADPIRDLADSITQALESLGFAREAREYRPHLTLARFKQSHASGLSRLREILDENTATEFGCVEVSEAVLYRSELSPSGPVYRRLAEFPLQPR